MFAYSSNGHPINVQNPNEVIPRQGEESTSVEFMPKNISLEALLKAVHHVDIQRLVGNSKIHYLAKTHMDKYAAA